MNGYALSKNADLSWSFRTVTSDMTLADGETFYESRDDFPQIAKDWFSSHPLI